MPWTARAEKSDLENCPICGHLLVQSAEYQPTTQINANGASVAQACEATATHGGYFFRA
jgi:hypothetical protein